MKALIRNKGETILETSHVQGIDWNTGAPLTSPEWCGGPYVFVKNYVAPTSSDDEVEYEVVEPVAEQIAETVTEDTVVIDGKEYTKEELRALLGE